MRIIRLKITPRPMPEAEDTKTPYAPIAIRVKGNISFATLITQSFMSILIADLKAIKILSIRIFQEQNTTKEVKDIA